MLPVFAQTPGPRAWAERMEQSVLFLVYPTHAVRHERIALALQDLPEDSPSRRRAARQIQAEAASRDTLLIALSQSFREHYRLHPVYLMADTTYQRYWKQGMHFLCVLSAESLDPSVQAWDPQRVLLLRQRAGDRETGTGITLWTLETGDGSAFPSRFPDSFSDSGNLGNRFLQFVQAIFRGGHRPDRLGEVLPSTNHLARQIQKKWGRYLKKMGFDA